METTIEKQVTEFFGDIDRHALKDLEKMLECVNYNVYSQRLAVPIALTCFSLLDMVGFLIRPINEQEKYKGLRSTDCNLKTSLERFFEKEISQSQRDFLVELYRHDMMHSFFPKASGIHKSIEHKEICTSNGEVWNFNVHPFAKRLITEFRLLSNFLLLDKRTIISKNLEVYNNDTNKIFLKYVGNMPKSPRKITEIITTTRRNP